MNEVVGSVATVSFKYKTAKLHVISGYIPSISTVIFKSPHICTFSNPVHVITGAYVHVTPSCVQNGPRALNVRRYYCVGVPFLVLFLSLSTV